MTNPKSTVTKLEDKQAIVIISGLHSPDPHPNKPTFQATINVSVRGILLIEE